MLFAEWYRICELPGANDAACTHYILQLHQNGLLKGDDMTDRFFRLLTVRIFFKAIFNLIIRDAYLTSYSCIRNFLSHIVCLLR
jgi:CCR4-NOT transcription complex subunit 1